MERNAGMGSGGRRPAGVPTKDVCQEKRCLCRTGDSLFTDDTGAPPSQRFKQQAVVGCTQQAD
ncbi:hypothetical protein D9M69_712460 [compost metagenome]